MYDMQSEAVALWFQRPSVPASDFGVARRLGRARHYPLMPQGVFDVDQIVWQHQQLLVRHRPRSLASLVKTWAKEYLLAPTIFLLISGIILIVPHTIIQGLGSYRIQNLMRRIAIRSIDTVGACLGIILSVPFLVIVPFLIKLDSSGPVFYKQRRVGMDRRKRERRAADLGSGGNRRQVDGRKENLYGKPFFIYKFRTMEDGAERRSGPVWAIQGDPRITAVGGWLRKFHIDEIPQFWNVLRGEMSLVGPRPERPELINEIINKIPDYRKRLNVKPGITGLAQICMGYDSCLEDVRRKIQFDLLYISNQSLRLQLRILLLTVVKILSSETFIDADFVDPGLKVERF